MLEKTAQAVIDLLRSDDLVGRQSITVRNSELFSLPPETVTLVIEGSEEAVRKAEEIGKGVLKALDKGTSDKILLKLKEEEDKADQGLGFIFE